MQSYAFFVSIHIIFLCNLLNILWFYGLQLCCTALGKWYINITFFQEILPSYEINSGIVCNLITDRLQKKFCTNISRQLLCYVQNIVWSNCHVFMREIINEMGHWSFDNGGYLSKHDAMYLNCTNSGMILAHNDVFEGMLQSLFASHGLNVLKFKSCKYAVVFHNFMHVQEMSTYYLGNEDCHFQYHISYQYDHTFQLQGATSNFTVNALYFTLH